MYDSIIICYRGGQLHVFDSRDSNHIQADGDCSCEYIVKFIIVNNIIVSELRIVQ